MHREIKLGPTQVIFTLAALPFVYLTLQELNQNSGSSYSTLKAFLCLLWAISFAQIAAWLYFKFTKKAS